MRETRHERELDSYVDSPSRAGKTAQEVKISGAGTSSENPLFVTGSTGGGGSSTDKVQDKYNINNLEDGDPLYAGFTDSTGKYLIKRFNESTGSMDYANISNNSGVANYASAWTNRATLTYSKFHELTGV